MHRLGPGPTKDSCKMSLWWAALFIKSPLVQVTVDNCTTAAYSLLNVVCQDRKGLVYDLMRTLKDTHIRVAYAKARQFLHACLLLCVDPASASSSFCLLISNGLPHFKTALSPDSWHILSCA